jgi:hypothetical protein
MAMMATDLTGVIRELGDGLDARGRLLLGSSVHRLVSFAVAGAAQPLQRIARLAGHSTGLVGSVAGRPGRVDPDPGDWSLVDTWLTRC